MNLFFSIARDLKQSFDWPSDSDIRPSSVAGTAIALRMLEARSKGPGVASILGHRISHLHAGNLRRLFQEIFVSRLYLPVRIPRDAVIIDCGCNIGMSILFFKLLYPDASVIGFEPHPALFEVLDSNIRENSLTNVQLHRKALADQAGTVEFHLNESDPGSLNMGLIRRSDTAESIAVDAHRLSDLLPEKVDLLKLDIEGAEHSVITDLFEQGKLANVDKIICEYHHHIEPGVDRLASFLEMFERTGFSYQLSSYTDRPCQPGAYQDIMVYAHRHPTSSSTG